LSHKSRILYLEIRRKGKHQTWSIRGLGQRERDRGALWGGGSLLLVPSIERVDVEWAVLKKQRCLGCRKFMRGERRNSLVGTLSSMVDFVVGVEVMACWEW